jgi:hypothetical protein
MSTQCLNCDEIQRNANQVIEGTIVRENNLIRALEKICVALDLGYSGNDPTDPIIQPALQAYTIARDALKPYQRPNTGSSGQEPPCQKRGTNE